ncbi:MAG: helix-turn-helix domain-containing protein [Actinobacteria bacterium]|nr:helix-turn-helix domain-containing protein [Actinomycetota bacterium]
MRENKAKKAEEVALFRYTVISEAISEKLSPAERGMAVRAIAAGTWVTPEGTERSFSRKTIDRWAQAYKAHGLAGLEPVPRADKGRPRAELATWLAEAARMRRELPARSSSQIVDAIGRAHRVVLAERTAGPGRREYGQPSPSPPSIRASLRKIQHGGEPPSRLALRLDHHFQGPT